MLPSKTNNSKDRVTEEGFIGSKLEGRKMKDFNPNSILSGLTSQRLIWGSGGSDFSDCQVGAGL